MHAFPLCLVCVAEQTAFVDSIEAGLDWLANRWMEDVEEGYEGAIYHRPADRNYDLHFNLPVGVADVRRRS